MSRLTNQIEYYFGTTYKIEQYDPLNEGHLRRMSKIFTNPQEKGKFDISIITSLEKDDYKSTFVLFKVKPFKTGCINYTKGAYMLINFKLSDRYSNDDDELDIDEEGIEKGYLREICVFDIAGNELRHPHVSGIGICIGNFADILCEPLQELSYFFASAQYMFSTLNNGSLNSYFEEDTAHKIAKIGLDNIDYDLAIEIRSSPINILYAKVLQLSLLKYNLNENRVFALINDLYLLFNLDSKVYGAFEIEQKLSKTNIAIFTDINLGKSIVIRLINKFGNLLYENTRNINTLKPLEFYIEKAKNLYKFKAKILHEINQSISVYYAELNQNLDKIRFEYEEKLFMVTDIQRFLWRNR